MTPIEGVKRGLIVGIIGTAVMTAAQELYGRVLAADGDSGGDEQEQGSPWEQASAPAKVGKRILEGVFKQEVGEDLIGPLTHGMHWGYGTANGVAFGVLQPSLGDTHPIRNGLGFGAAVMASSYVQLVPMGLYEPPWNYSLRMLTTELGFHLAYGLGVGLGWVLVAD
ncbi:MAG: hypothetical protein ACR2NA_14075 [Solirubrobacterales bacterium]